MDTENYEDFSNLSKPYFSIINELSLYVLSGIGFIAIQILTQIIFQNIRNILSRLSRSIIINSNALQKISSIPLSATHNTLSYNNFLVSEGISFFGSALEAIDSMNLFGLNPDIATYNILLDYFIKEKNYLEARKLYSKLSKKEKGINIIPDIITFNTWLKGMLNRIYEAVDTFQENEINNCLNEIKYFNLAPNLITYNTILSIFSVNRNMEYLWHYYYKMKKMGLIPDNYTYSIVIKAIKTNDKNNSNLNIIFNSLLNSIDNGFIQIDEVLLNTLIEASLKFNDYEKAEVIVNLMKDNGINPSVITYCILIKGYGQINRPDRIMHIYEEIEKNNVKKNEILFGCLIDSLIMCDKFNLAKRIFEIMKKEGFQPNIIIYTTIIKGFTREKNMAMAKELFYFLINSRKVDINIIFINSILECTIQCEDFEFTKDVFLFLKGNEAKNLEMDLITYLSLIRAFSNSRDSHLVLDIYNELLQFRKEIIDDQILNTTLMGLYKNNYIDEGIKIFEDSFRLLNISRSNNSYSKYIKLLSKSSNWPKALNILKMIQDDNLIPSLIVYTCLLQLFIKKKQIDSAISVFDRVVLENHTLDNVIFNTIINGCIYAGKLENACNYLFMSMKSNIILNIETYTVVLKNLKCSKTILNDQRGFMVKEINSFLRNKSIKSFNYEEDNRNKRKDYNPNSHYKSNKIKYN